MTRFGAFDETRCALARSGGDQARTFDRSASLVFDDEEFGAFLRGKRGAWRSGDVNGGGNGRGFAENGGGGVEGRLDRGDA